MDASVGSSRLRNGRVSLPGQIYMATAVTSGCKMWFSEFRLACIAARTIANASCWPDAKLLAWVLMPDHAHLLLELGHAEDISRVLQRVKALVSVALRPELQGEPLWQAGFHDHAVRNCESVRDTARYLIANPIRAGLVSDVGDYPFWDAGWLEPGHHPLDL